MKNTLLALALLTTISANAQEPAEFSLKGTINNSKLPVAKVLLSYRAGDKTIRDSVEVKDGQYNFSGKIYEPTMASLQVKYRPEAGDEGKPRRGRDLASVFLMPATMQVNSVDSFSNITVTGSAAHDDFSKLTAMLKPVNEVNSKFAQAYTKANQEKDMEARKAAEAKLDSMDGVIRGVYGQFLKNNSRSPIAPFALSQFAGWDIDVQAVEPLYEKLSAEQRNTPSAKTMAAKLAIARKTAVGALAMNFTQNDTLGKPVSLSDFRGKYVLVDFWASWCGPCRQENPNVVKAYQAFKDKNFTIIGVSLDQPGAKDKWMDAIHADNLTWTHVSDLKYWENEVARQYGIQAIPQNLLIDPNGKIIARNLNGEKLEEKLGEIYSK